MKSNELMNEFVPDSIKSDIITSANRLARLRNENNWDEGVEMCESHLEEIALASWFLWFTPISVIEEMQEQGWQSEVIQEALRCAFSMSHTDTLALVSRTTNLQSTVNRW